MQWIGCGLEVGISLHRGFTWKFLISFIELEQQFIYSAEHLRDTENKITEGINEKSKCYMD